ncbi:NfeD family protein [Kitasatospora viridis]|uniref:Membrane protein implicated in regulation of membrane protease activity n=1 Tax=Kitasatospora viridis TaxID=281105 RepID=A0A561UCV8_9ACTN|nr:NfeD family protein [Kitasatospora viridis]TWF97212.1 membrane protein implicated in regulation of membrane protease activity [Kitasatospora viridis]
MDSWVWWLLGAVVFCVPLVATALPEFGMFAVGAAVAAAVAGLGAGAVWQFAGFLVVSVALLAVVRPLAYRRLNRGPQVRMGIEALVGARAVVQERVDGLDGRIKLNGEIWSARALHPDRVYEPGQQVDVIEIQGATALVD